MVSGLRGDSLKGGLQPRVRILQRPKKMCVFITAVPIIKLFVVVVYFIAAVPNTKPCAWGKEDSGGHVL